MTGGEGGPQCSIGADLGHGLANVVAPGVLLVALALACEAGRLYLL